MQPGEYPVSSIDMQAWLAGQWHSRLSLCHDGLTSIPLVTQPYADIVVVVLREMSTLSFVTGSLSFMHCVPPAELNNWFRNKTRTIFLAGNPVNLQGQFSFRYQLENFAAWFGPANASKSVPLRRMLRSFDGVLDERYIFNCEVQARPSLSTGLKRTLTIATGQLSLLTYMIHLHHVIAEATLRGLLKVDDRLVIENVTEFSDCDYTAMRSANYIRVVKNSAKVQYRAVAYLA